MMENHKNNIKPLSHFVNIPVYASGEKTIKGIDNVLKLSANENLNGPCQEVLEQFSRFSNNLFEYPESGHFELRKAISNSYNINIDRIICGSGSDEIIQLLCRCFCKKDDEIIHTEHGFLMYKLSALAVGAKPVKVEEEDRLASIDNILKAVTEKTKIVFLANPNNPTGTMVPEHEVNKLINQMPKNILLVLDGAYSEYVDNFDGGISLVGKHKNVFMTRTFSKIYGLGGLRVGWGYGDKNIINVLNAVRPPFNVSSVGLKMAELSIKNSNFVEEQRKLNSANRDTLRKKLITLGLEIDKSFANFLLIRFSSQNQAEGADKFLKSRGVIARKVDSYGLPNCLRLTIGNEQICQRVYMIMSKFVDKNASI